MMVKVKANKTKAIHNQSNPPTMTTKNNTPRIASMLASSTEILYALGLGNQVVAISHECDYPPQACNKPRITHANIDSTQSASAIDQQVRQLMKSVQPLYEIDVETLASLSPDLIITQAQCEVCAISYNDVLAVTNSHPALRQCEILSMNPTTLDEILVDIQRIADAANVAPLGQQYVSQLRQRLEFIDKKLRDLASEDKPRTICIEWVSPLMVAANWMPNAITLAGGHADFTTAGQPSTYTDWSDVIAYDPQVIVVACCGFALDRSIEEAVSLAHLPNWKKMSAVRAGRVYAADGNAHFHRAGPRLIDTAEALAYLLHPDLFPEFSSLASQITRQVV